jgi:toxin ParE1/3/4
VAQDSYANALRLADRIEEQTESLADYPHRGHPVEEFPGLPLREVLVASYRIIYRVQGDEIQVVGVIHSARLLRRALADRDLEG